MIKISSITIQKLKNNKLKKALPEFYELRKIIENNEWHKESVFKHTLSVFKNLKKLHNAYKNKLNKYLSKKIDRFTRKELLFLAALFHDIAKKETITQKKGVTQCPKHEIKGAVKAKRILKKFDLSAREMQFVISIIKSHGLTHTLPKVNKKSYANFKNRHKSIFLELILLAMADTLASRLKESRAADFNMRLKFYKSVISKWS